MSHPRDLFSVRGIPKEPRQFASLRLTILLKIRVVILLNYERCTSLAEAKNRVHTKKGAKPIGTSAPDEQLLRSEHPNKRNSQGVHLPGGQQDQHSIEAINLILHSWSCSRQTFSLPGRPLLDGAPPADPSKKKRRKIHHTA
ncbi:unnamed protein product [Plasmodium vivax]|uniref:(malaria parasite P. vivax) hypothetical protein n=1 Tax=Plasmodium vivax TaxID=5855 RepID=A0A8S4H6R4_PLAVI|nr:unnamed protein product [Plasmodium vivax]CAI7723063.1 hypothetical protein PVPAM_130056900 [Plasmodium vivax]